MPVPVQLEQLAASVHFLEEQPGTRSGPAGSQRRPGLSPDGTISFPAMSPSGGALPGTGMPALELYEIQDRSPSDNMLNATSVVCKNAHMVLRTNDGFSPLDMHSAVGSAFTIEDGTRVLKTNNVTLLPGNNSVIFTALSTKPGTYTLRQLCATVGRVQFVLPHIYPIVKYEVYSQEPQLTIEPLTESLLAGLPQRVKFTILTGHYEVKKGDALQLSNTDSMPILHSSSCSARILSGTGELVGEPALSIQASEKVTSISLPLTPPYHTLEFQLEVLCHIPLSPARVESERLTNGEIRHRPRSRTRFNSGMACIDQKVSIDCPWSIYSTLISLTFYTPFRAKHSLLSAGKRKYIQVCLENVSNTNFRLANQTLSECSHTPSLQLLSLNSKTDQVVYSKQCVYGLWEVNWTTEPLPCLQCVFSASFSPADAPDTALKPYSYEFQLERVSTLYSVKADIQPAVGEEECRAGTLCQLEVSVTRLIEPTEADGEDEELTENDGLRTTKLMYEVVDNSSNWAVCGKSSGLVSMPVAVMATHKVQMEVMPLFAGKLPFPSIRVFKYLPHSTQPTSQPDTDSCLENDNLSLLDKGLEEQGDTASLRSRGSIHSVGSNDQQQRALPMPRLEPFSPGQVFNSSQTQQVLVLPSTDDHVLEVNVT